MKEMNEFVAAMKAAFEAEFPECEIRTREVKKNNDLTLTGMTAVNPDCNICPTVYMEPAYEKYVERCNEITEGIAFSEISHKVIDSYKEHIQVDDFDVESYTNFEKTKKSLVFNLVNREKNAELLDSVPHRNITGSYELVYRSIVEEIKDSTASILVTNSHMGYWGVSEEDLYKAALANMSRLKPVQVIDMQAMVRNIMMNQFGASSENQDNSLETGDWRNIPADELQMLVLSSEDKLNGAAEIAVPGVLQEIADTLDTNFFIIPSSIHEVLLLPDNGAIDPCGLTQMVSEVNENEVKPEEVLGYEVMYFDREIGELSIVGGSLSR